MDITFAHRSFRWESEAKGKAHVTVVIIGFGRNFDGRKRLFHYEGKNIIEEQPNHISPYLIGIEEPLPVVMETSKPRNNLPEMVMGSKPIDGGNYIFTDEQKDEFLSKEPAAEKFLRPYVSAKDFLNNRHRWILALHDAKPNELQNMSETKKRINLVREFRLKSKSKPTQKLAETPKKYHLNVIPDKPFLIIPSTSSKRREYIPMAYMEPLVIPSNANMVILDASVCLFGLLTSKMHMLWMKVVGGRLKSDFRYSAGLVYNTFPTPDKELDALKKYAQKILDIRNAYPESSLADMYDPDSMPDDLKTAHMTLDNTVDKLYRKDPFVSNHDRMEFLLEKYQKMVSKQTRL